MCVFMTHFRSALPSAYNSWSPWAWDWWLNQPEHDVTKEEKTKEEAKETAGNQQAPADQTTKKTWNAKYIFL